MTVFENHERYDTSNVWFEDGRIRIYDKKNKVPQMHHIDYGLGLLRKKALSFFPEDEFVDLASVYSNPSRRHNCGYEVKKSL